MRSDRANSLQLVRIRAENEGKMRGVLREIENRRMRERKENRGREMERERDQNSLDNSLMGFH